MSGRFQVRRAIPGDAEGVARVKIDAWRDAYGPFLDPELLRKLDIAKETARWRNALNNIDPREPVWIACDGKQILGFLVAGQNRYPEVPCDAELHAIYIHPKAQRRGVGKAMLSAAVDWLIEQGYESMAVFVFKDNVKGTGFYRALGAELFDSGEYELAGVKYPDESYVWRSLAELQRRMSS